jgi:tartrate dehydrogenase/decarboxylase/D-malate dehydrogenase
MMLDHLGHADAAACMLEAIEKVLGDPASRTADLGGQAKTEQCGRAIVEAIG